MGAFPDLTMEPPSISDFSEHIRLSLFDDLCCNLLEKYGAKPVIEYSRCSLERGWNLKFKKAGKSLCTIYPREGFCTVMVVIGRKEKAQVEAALPAMSEAIQRIYHNTEEGGGQRWLMIDLSDNESLYCDVLKLIEIRKESR